MFRPGRFLSAQYLALYGQKGSRGPGSGLLTPRTDMAPLHDRSMWHRLVARTHPDAGGDHELYIWTTQLREFVVGNHIEPVRPPARRSPQPHPNTRERVPFGQGDLFAEGFNDFNSLTAKALGMADDLLDPYRSLLQRLSGVSSDPLLIASESRGATYKQLAYIGHLTNMTVRERKQWYRIAESIPLSERHAGHIIKVLKDREMRWSA